MSENALTVREMSLSDTLTLGETMARSGYFEDAKQAAQAVVKIMAGRELGFREIASMTGIYIIKGRVSVGANLMAAAVKRDPRYDYRVVTLTDEVCEIAFFEQGKESGRSVFTREDAQRAGTQNMAKFPRNMLFARAMSNGIKWFCPDACGGQPVYTPEELGAEVDGDGNMIVDVKATVVERTPEPDKANGEKPTHWIDGVTSTGATVRAKFWAWCGEQGLSNAEVYQALGVEHVHDYAGTMTDAKQQIDSWLRDRVEQPEAETDTDEMFAEAYGV
jgi:hypothetical protein